jgi:hypothetical protein
MRVTGNVKSEIKVDEIELAMSKIERQMTSVTEYTKQAAQSFFAKDGALSSEQFVAKFAKFCVYHNENCPADQMFKHESQQSQISINKINDILQDVIKKSNTANSGIFSKLAQLIARLFLGDKSIVVDGLIINVSSNLFTPKHEVLESPLELARNKNDIYELVGMTKSQIDAIPTRPSAILDEEIENLGK